MGLALGQAVYCEDTSIFGNPAVDGVIYGTVIGLESPAFDDARFVSRAFVTVRDEDGRRYWSSEERWRPIPPILNLLEEWMSVPNSNHINRDFELFQCRTLRSLFKYVYPNGRTAYSDLGAYSCVDIDRPDDSHYSSRVQDIMDELNPITFPYTRTGAIKVFCSSAIGDIGAFHYDIFGVHHVIHPNGKTQMVDRYIRYTSTGQEELTVREFYKLLSMHAKQTGKEINNETR